MVVGHYTGWDGGDNCSSVSQAYWLMTPMTRERGRMKDVGGLEVEGVRGVRGHLSRYHLVDVWAEMRGRVGG